LEEREEKRAEARNVVDHLQDLRGLDDLGAAKTRTQNREEGRVRKARRERDRTEGQHAQE